MKRVTYFDILARAARAQPVSDPPSENLTFSGTLVAFDEPPKKLSPSVQALADYVGLPENTFLRIYIGRMMEEISQNGARGPKTPEGFFRLLDEALYKLPRYGSEFMAALPFLEALIPFMTNSFGWAFFTQQRVQPYLSDILKAYRVYLESPASLACLSDSDGNWLSEQAKRRLSLDDYVYDSSKPHGGFKSWNEFFTRQFKNIDASRPLEPDPTGKVVSSPVDGTVLNISQQVHRKTAFELKGEEYYLADLLAERDGSPLLKPFIDGLAVQILLSPSDYHRWHAPVSGKVTKVHTVPGYFFALPAPALPDEKNPPVTFMSHVNTRTIVFIEPENPAIGALALIFVGLTEVSSCSATVEEGASVKRGQEIGHFAFGGSTCCILFDGSKIDPLSITGQGTANASPDEKDNEVQVRAKIASAR